MLRALRRSRLTFWLAICALLTTLPASFASWHDVGDDPLCNPAIVVHDHAAHQIAAATTSPSVPEHCAICHWLQSLRGATSSDAFIVPHGLSDPLPAAPSVLTLARILEGRSGRAPPQA